MKNVYRVASLYAVLVIVSAIVISVSLDINFLVAVQTASIGCVFKTMAAWTHGLIFSRL